MRGGKRAGAGRPARSYELKVLIGNEVMVRLDRLALKKHLDRQLETPRAQRLLRAVETADAAARQKIGASAGFLAPGGKAVRFVSEARRLAWERAVAALDKDAPRREAAAKGSRQAATAKGSGGKQRPWSPAKQLRVYDEVRREKVIAKVADDFGVSFETARRCYSWWRKEKAVLMAALPPHSLWQPAPD